MCFECPLCAEHLATCGDTRWFSFRHSPWLFRTQSVGEREGKHNCHTEQPLDTPEPGEVHITQRGWSGVAGGGSDTSVQFCRLLSTQGNAKGEVTCTVLTTCSCCAKHYTYINSGPHKSLKKEILLFSPSQQSRQQRQRRFKEIVQGYPSGRAGVWTQTDRPPRVYTKSSLWALGQREQHTQRLKFKDRVISRNFTVAYKSPWWNQASSIPETFTSSIVNATSWGSSLETRGQTWVVFAGTWASRP